MEKKHMHTECCICRDWRDEKKKWRTPSPEERRALHFDPPKEITHVLCPACFKEEMQKYGMSNKEILEILKKHQDHVGAHT